MGVPSRCANITMLFIVCLTQQYDVKLSYAQLIKLHVSTPWGHLQAYKIQIIQDTSEVVTYRIPWFTVQHNANHGIP